MSSLRILPKIKRYPLLFVRILVLVFVLISTCGSAQRQTEKTKLEKEKLQIEEEIKGLKKMLAVTSNSHKQSVSQFQIIESTLRKRQQLIDNIQVNITKLDGEVARVKTEIARLNREYRLLKSDYARMIRASYANRERYSWLMFILASDDFNQAYIRLRYYQQYSEFRKRQALGIETTRSDLAKRRAELSQIIARRRNSLQELTNEKTKLQSEQEVQNRLVKSLESKKKTLQEDIKKKQLAAAQLKKAIERVIAEEIRLASERSKSKSKSKSKTKPKSAAAKTRDVFELSPDEQVLARDFSDNRGHLPWPVDKGYVVEEYGEHPHPVTRSVKTKNNGIDILCPGGSSAKVVFDGTVSRVIDVPGYHHVVIVRHGNFLSVYSNILSVSVKSGMKISRSEILGQLACDASGKNTMIHFELWNGTQSVNPALWLSHRR